MGECLHALDPFFLVTGPQKWYFTGPGPGTEWNTFHTLLSTLRPRTNMAIVEWDDG